MRFINTRKRGFAAVATLVVVGASAFGAYAYFTANGAGTGTAKTATASALSVTQVGAGYDSLIPTNNYTQDQCFGCAQISELGNDVTLANPGAQQLTSAVVAIDNWGPALSNQPITLTINNSPNAPITVTQNFNFPAAAANGDPTLTNVTFNFASQGTFVDQEFVYGISFDPNADLNVALSSSPNDLSVGSDTHKGTVWVDTAAGPGIDGDFPSCTTPGSGFAVVTTNCGPSASGNPGAYGTDGQVAAGSDDIPAVEFNVVGGTVAGLSPGSPAQPVDFAITNPGSSNVRVNSVSTTVSGISNAGGNQNDEVCGTGLYSVTGSPAAINATIPPGTTVFSPSGTAISLPDDNKNQDNCEGATANLSFLAS